MVLAFCYTMLATVASVWAQDCNVRAIVQRQTPVFERPATEFNTASGWVYSSPVAVLASNVTVFICEERSVWFGVISQDWSNIAFWNSGQWQYGWVVKQNLRRSSADQKSMSFAWIVQQAFSTSIAHAQPPVISESPPSTAGPAPPPTGSQKLGSLVSTEDSAVASFYAVLFLCMVLGMLGKVAFDFLTDPGKFDWKARARAGVLPLIFSPIVFLSIMKAADTTSAATLSSFIAVACTAFQNGFFWHTIFDRSGR
jgi:hypothetical protein